MKDGSVLILRLRSRAKKLDPACAALIRNVHLQIYWLLWKPLFIQHVSDKAHDYHSKQACYVSFSVPFCSGDTCSFFLFYAERWRWAKQWQGWCSHCHSHGAWGRKWNQLIMSWITCFLWFIFLYWNTSTSVTSYDKLMPVNDQFFYVSMYLLKMIKTECYIFVI